MSAGSHLSLTTRNPAGSKTSPRYFWKKNKTKLRACNPEIACLQNVMANQLDLRSIKLDPFCKLLQTFGNVIVEQSILILNFISWQANECSVGQCTLYNACFFKLVWRDGLHHKVFIIGTELENKSAGRSPWEFWLDLPNSSTMKNLWEDCSHSRVCLPEVRTDW